MPLKDAAVGAALHLGFLLRRGLLLFIFGEQMDGSDYVFRAVSSVLVLGVMMAVGSLGSRSCGNPIIELYYRYTSTGGTAGMLNLIPVVLGQAAAGSLVLRLADHFLPAWNSPFLMECIPTQYSDGSLFMREILSSASLVIILGMAHRKGLTGGLPAPLAYFVVTLFWTDPCINPSFAISHIPYFKRGSALQPLTVGATAGAALGIYVLFGSDKVKPKDKSEGAKREPQRTGVRRKRK